MRRKKLLIVSVSGKEYPEDTLIGNSVVTRLDDIEFKFIPKNTKSLASIYNEYISEEYNDYIVIFTHDDVYLCDGDFVEKCFGAVRKFDVFGVAGGSGGLKIEKGIPSLWHLISKNKVGFAGHFADSESHPHLPSMNLEIPFDTVSWVTNFGVSPANATLIDGVFLGVNVERVLDAGVKFDEECPSRFHFYDLLFCVNAKKKGLTLGVYPFNIFHASHGLKSVTEEFRKGDLYFKEYCGKLV